MQFKNVLELVLYHTGYIYGQMVDKKKTFRAAAVKQIEIRMPSQGISKVKVPCINSPKPKLQKN